MDTLINDLRYAAKMLLKSKGVTVVAMISLAVGIGANSVIFSLVNSLLLQPLPVAYLLDPTECNNDNTNYWIFSEAGLRRILSRTGWDILDFITLGNDRDSDPASPKGDERAFCLVRSRVWQSERSG